MDAVDRGALASGARVLTSVDVEVVVVEGEFPLEVRLNGRPVCRIRRVCFYDFGLTDAILNPTSHFEREGTTGGNFVLTSDLAAAAIAFASMAVYELPPELVRVPE